MYIHGIRALFPFPGYVVKKVTMAADIVQVILRRDRRFRIACRACGTTMAVNRTNTQTARDLALGTARLVVLFVHVELSTHRVYRLVSLEISPRLFVRVKQS